MGLLGQGKSAIMQTLCRKLQDAGYLGGTFFFKRGHSTRGDAKVLFATLAYQLALNDDNLKPLISQRVEDDPSIVGRDMDVQFHKLIVEPLRGSAPPLLLIDGLDECNGDRVQVQILRLIENVVSQHPNTFRFLVASRPEAYIRETFSEPSFYGILDSLNVEQSFEDVRKYLRNEFARIHREHRETMGGIPTPWPSPDVLNILVQKSSGYFIYGSTVIKFIDDKYSRPTERLAVVQNLTPSESDAPFEALDQLYIQILSGVPVRFRSKLRDILYCALFSWLRHKLKTFLQIERLLELQPGDVRLIIRPLHSVLDVPADSGGISAHHASFLDFLQDPQRSSNFHIDLETRMNVARAVLKTLSDDNHWFGPLDDPLAWCLNDTDLISCITSLQPTAELVPHMRLVNPEFLWWNETDTKFDFVSRLLAVLTWLRAIHPTPEDLIDHWECYHFMFEWDDSYHDYQLQAMFTGQDNFAKTLSLSSQSLRMLQTKMSGVSLASLADCHQFVVQFPDFIRILQARWLLQSHLFSSSCWLVNLY
ncbi:hypothetical protein B0H13DRAFT_874986, partial [Mycena leptocephala]